MKLQLIFYLVQFHLFRLNFIYGSSFNLFTKVCLYDESKEEISFFGESLGPINGIESVKIDDNLPLVAFRQLDRQFKITFKKNLNQFNPPIIKYLELHIGVNTGIKYTLNNIHLEFPYEEPDTKKMVQKLDVNRSAIVSTLVQVAAFSNRIYEWIDYQIKLGFSGIVIFDNTLPNDFQSKCLPIEPNTERTPCVIPYNSTWKDDIIKKYRDKIPLIAITSYPYVSMTNRHWDQIQRMSLIIGTQAMREKCHFIALIDVDEFIYFPDNPSQGIENFLQKHKDHSVTVGSLLTRTHPTFSDQLINNDVLKHAKYINRAFYTKTIFNTKLLQLHEFITTPHIHPTAIQLDASEIIYYHAWLHGRGNAPAGSLVFAGLQNFLYGQ